MKLRTLTFLLLTPIIGFGSPKICLTMIVKNEAPIIERCLQSVAPLIDCYCICDTGSTDNTCALIEEFMQKANIPGRILQQPWQDFGHNRTQSAIAAKQALNELGMALEESYLLLLDADMVLISHQFKKEDLCQNHYSICQKKDDIYSYQLRLAKADFPLEAKGIVYETWNVDKTFRINELQIIDRDDSSCKIDKISREKKALEEALKVEPTNRRYVFYYALLQEMMKAPDEAIKWYQMRTTLRGDIEEIWYSYYRLGALFEGKNQWETAFQHYLEAYQVNPQRAEPLLKIATHYRQLQQYHIATTFARLGKTVAFPQDQNLFINKACYDYLLDEELSLSAYYTDFKEEGFAAANRLLLKKDIPHYLKEWAAQNIIFYTQNLKTTHFEPIVFDLPFIREGFAARYQPMNPSICKTENGYELICRTVNYIQIGAREFQTLDILDTKNVIKTRNFLLTYDKNLKLQEQKEIVENLERKKTPCYNSEGIEDCRLFAFQNGFAFTCTTCDTSPINQREISLCTFKKSSENTLLVDKLTPLKGPDPTRCEKNWVPFIHENALNVIYSYDPFIIYRPDAESGACPEIVHYNPHQDFSRFRGSAAPIAFDEGYLLITHEVAYLQNRTYLHRFVYLDKDFNITKVSLPFTFFHQGVEFCCSCTLDHEGKELIIPIGVEDREAYLLFVSVDEVRKMLNQQN